MPWALAPWGLGCSLLDSCAHRDAGYARGAQIVRLHPLGRPDGTPGARGVYSECLAEDGSSSGFGKVDCDGPLHLKHRLAMV
jgi:hypothetical protein